MSETMSLSELERIAAVGSGRDLARERREDRDAAELCDRIEEADAERACDAIEEVFRGYVDELTGYPLPGFESPRFVDTRREEYARWIQSEAGARTRRNMHPRLDARMRDAFARRDAEAGRSVESR